MGRALYNPLQMSQITRCPACSTQFKVVADQLRISEGWVRCGNCAEVFDASQSLMPAPPLALLPDVSLTDVRPPPMPVARPDESTRAWGAAPTAARAAAPATPSVSAPIKEAGLPPPPTAHSVGAGRDPVSPLLQTPQGQAPVLDVPPPVPPAFLTSVSSAPSKAEQELGLEPLSPFAWSADRSRRSDAPAPKVSAPEPVVPQREESRVLTADMLELVLQEPPRVNVAASPVIPPQESQSPVPQLGGYELPYAEDFADTALLPEDAKDLDVEAEAVGRLETGTDAPSKKVVESGYPPLELPAKRFSAAPDEPSAEGGVLAGSKPVMLASEALVDMPTDPLGEPPLPAVEFPTAVPEPVAKKVDESRAADAVDTSVFPDEEEISSQETTEDVSFVKAARRRAFWRRPMVRVALSFVSLCLFLLLVTQGAVYERNRLAAMEPRLRPLLQALCQPLECVLAPQRQISDVVIDSSAFNKARGDSYVLALTMKSRASIPLEMPAVELTLTDAQDQPVLRRVLMPTELGAPQELPASGEWTASVSVLVTTGGSKVAGYRLLAFYP